MMNNIQEQSWRAFKPQGGGLMIVGGLLIVLGVLALGAPLFTGRVIEIWVGANILIAGLCQIVAALKTRGWQHGLPGFLVGSIGLIGGSILLVHPMLGLAIFTLILAIYFLVEGLGKIILALQVKPIPGWGWMLFSGAITLLLGLMIWRQWPLSGAWAIGTLVGINIIFTGWTLVSLGLAVKRAAPWK